MTTSFVWPQVVRPPAPEAGEIPADPPPPLGFGAAAFGASLGPELSRVAGARVTVRLHEGQAAGMSATMLVACRLPVAGGALLVTIDGHGGAVLLDRMFGARPGDVARPLENLPPASGSWMAFARLLAGACQQAASVGNCPATAVFAIPARPMPPEPDDATVDVPPFVYALDIDGVPGRIQVQPLVSTPGRLSDRDRKLTSPQLADWRDRARGLAMALDLPAAMRIAETRMPMARVAALRPGDIIPIDPPRHVELMVGGHRFATLPVEGLAHAPDPRTPDRKDRR